MSKRGITRGQLKKRSPAKHDPFRRVLIVCEGSKTEPSYFKELINHHGLNPSAIKIDGHGSDPLSVVQRAQQLMEREQSKGDGYDEVYCVFDQDEHATFLRASEKAEAKKLNLARSWPCFEFWLLLHFEYTRKPYGRSGRRSPAENCIRDLKKHINKYEKTTTGLYGKLRDKLDNAKKGAHSALNDATETRQPNPSTEIHKLVGYLQSLESRDSQQA